MQPTAADYAHMARAVQLARQGASSTHPNPRVGCVVVGPAGQVIGEGWHERAGEAHAEVRALAAAGAAARGATVYVTLEPCCHTGRTPPCTDALIAAGIARVVYALRDPNPRVAGEGEAQLRAAGIEVSSGLLQSEAEELNRGFVLRMQQGRPWICSKVASSLDGRTALADGRSQWITGAAARADVQRLRARSSAVLTGSGTVLADDPRLTVRASDGSVGSMRQPWRVLVDSSLRVTTAARLFSEGGPVLVACHSASAAAVAARDAIGVRTVALPGEARRVDLTALLRHLATLEMNEVLVEAGPVLNGALLDANLLDELIVYQASTVIGADAHGMFAVQPLSSLAEQHRFELQDVRRVGDDLRLSYRRRIKVA